MDTGSAIVKENMLKDEDKVNSLTGYEDIHKALESLLVCGESMTVWAKLAKLGPGYIRCEELGVYIVSEEFFDYKLKPKN